MKNNLKLAVLAAVVLLASCSTEEATITDLTDTPEDGMGQMEENGNVEDTPLQANMVSDNVVINGGSKNEGMPPTPNEAITLDLSSSTKTALLDVGFDITLNSDANIIGAYLQFKSNDGTLADSYYDIDLEANISNAKFPNRNKFRRTNTLAALPRKAETTVDVDFGTSIEPGTFCYELCVYDADGNISAPEEVCMTVESWGDNTEAIGEWKFVRHTNHFEGNMSFEPDTEVCSDHEGTRLCSVESGLRLNVQSTSCRIKEYIDITLNADGTYSERDKESTESIITSITAPNTSGEATLEEWENSCDIRINSQSEITYEGNGRWAYINESDSFIFVEYESVEVLRTEEREEVFEDFGDPGLWYGSGGANGIVTLVDGQLIIADFEETTTVYEKE